MVTLPEQEPNPHYLPCTSLDLLSWSLAQGPALVRVGEASPEGSQVTRQRIGAPWVGAPWVGVPWVGVPCVEVLWVGALWVGALWVEVMRVGALFALTGQSRAQ